MKCRAINSQVSRSLWIIIGGIVLEPPAALIEAINNRLDSLK